MANDLTVWQKLVPCKVQLALRDTPHHENRHSGIWSIRTTLVLNHGFQMRRICHDLSQIKKASRIVRRTAKDWGNWATYLSSIIARLIWARKVRNHSSVTGFSTAS